MRHLDDSLTVQASLQEILTQLALTDPPSSLARCTLVWILRRDPGRGCPGPGRQKKAKPRPRRRLRAPRMHDCTRASWGINPSRPRHPLLLYSLCSFSLERFAEMEAGVFNSFCYIFPECAFAGEARLPAWLPPSFALLHEKTRAPDFKLAEG